MHKIIFNKKQLKRQQLLALIFILFYLQTSYATNGLNQIGFGTESVGMGGADIAVARDTSALNTNPAGLSQITNNLIDINGAIVYTKNIKHKDQFGNDVNNTADLPLLGSIGYAKQYSPHKLTFGIGMFAQGGTGGEYDNLNTAFGTTDNLSVELRILRIIPGVAWKASDSISLGLSLIGTYADLSQEVFPNTSFNNTTTPSQSFFGYRLSDMNDFNIGLKLGSMFEINDSVKIGVVYTSKVKLELKGQMDVNLSSIGLGNVTYANTTLKGIDQPEELGIGISFLPTKKTLFSVELNWINWSDAISKSTVEASKPNNSAAIPSLKLVTDHDWRDQYVVAVGAAYQWSENTILRAGYNYGRNPIPNETLNPLLNNITEQHLTFGFGHTLNDEWRFDGAFKWHFYTEETYTNPNLFFGQDTVAAGDLFAIHVSASRAW